MVCSYAVNTDGVIRLAISRTGWRITRQPLAGFQFCFLEVVGLDVLRSLLVRVILAAGNATILACLASRPEVPYTQWYIQSGYLVSGFLAAVTLLDQI